jgi:hypothetical protein
MVYLPLGTEHRWGERVRVDLPVEVHGDGQTSVGGVLRNLSLSGALLNSSHEWRLNAMIGVRIALPPPSSESCLVKARVSRKPVHGVGLEWCEFAPAIVKDLLRLSPQP